MGGAKSAEERETPSARRCLVRAVMSQARIQRRVRRTPANTRPQPRDSQARYMKNVMSVVDMSDRREALLALLGRVECIICWGILLRRVRWWL